MRGQPPPVPPPVQCRNEAELRHEGRTRTGGRNASDASDADETGPPERSSAREVESSRFPHGPDAGGVKRESEGVPGDPDGGEPHRRAGPSGDAGPDHDPDGSRNGVAPGRTIRGFGPTKDIRNGHVVRDRTIGENRTQNERAPQDDRVRGWAGARRSR